MDALVPAIQQFSHARDWSSAVLYSVVTDRFAVPEAPAAVDLWSRHGGDLRSLAGCLPYVAGLGCTGLLITPVYRNEPGGYHGYWPVDFDTVDPGLGTADDLRRLGQSATTLGLDLILDVVANHTAPTHPWTRDPSRAHWFHRRGPIRDWENPVELENGDLASLPDLAQEVPEVADLLAGNAAAWMRLAGASGVRVDAAKHLPKWFLARLATRVAAERPGALVLGEVAHGDRLFLEGYAGSGLNALLDFPLCDALRAGFRQGGDLRVLAEAIDGRTGVGGGRFLWATFIDNHDLPRFRHIAGPGPGGLVRLRQALTALLTLPGFPIIYYGTECGMDGGPDPDCRRPMAWGSNPELALEVGALIRRRRTQPLFAGGRVRVLSAGREFVTYRLEPLDAGGAGGAHVALRRDDGD